MSAVEQAAETTPAIDRAAAAWLGRIDAGLSPLEQKELARWQAADPRHARALARQEKTWQFFDRPKGAQAEALVEALAGARVRRRRRRVAGAAAVLMVCLAVAGVWERVWSPAGQPPVAARVVLPEKRILPDGSSVELRPGAELAVEFSPEWRRVRLNRGEALFQVAKNPARPFVVAAGGVEFRAVGTAFSVDYSTQSVALLVTEGRVAVSTGEVDPVAAGGGAAVEPGPKAEAFTVDAGERVVVNLAAARPAMERPVAVPAAEVAERLDWRGARLEFTDNPLGEAVELFNRHSGDQAKLVIDPGSPGLGDLQISGYFRARNVDAFLILLDQTLGIEARREGDRIILRRAGAGKI